MKEFDIETILVLATMAFIGAIGLVAFLALILGISVMEIGIIYTWGIILGITGMFFGVLVLVTFTRILSAK